MTRRVRPFVSAEGQNVFSLSRICFQTVPDRLVPCDKAIYTTREMKSPDMPVIDKAIQYLLHLLFNQLNALSPATTVECPRRLANNSVSM